MRRLLALIRKEFLAIKHDKKSLVVVIIPPLIQVLIFSFAATLEVKNMNLIILDKDGSSQSRALIREFKGSRYIKTLQLAKSYEQGKEQIDKQNVLAFIVIPSEFAKQLHQNSAKLQLIFDGRRSNSAQIAESYLNQIILKFQSNQLGKNPIEVISRSFYNQNLNNFWWIVPNLFGSITMVVAIILTALSIARERELGTFEQILVSPLSSFEILLGKLLPALLISVFESSIILFVAIYAFGVPLNGSVWLLYLSVITFLFSMSGVGLFISAISNTQQQAILGAFVVLLPSFLLSGFATPVENIPSWLQPLSNLIPLKYYLILIKGVFLKDISLNSAIAQLFPMFFLGIIAMLVAMFFFKKKSV